VTPISAAEVHAAMTAKGGFSPSTFAQWGVPWPPPKGWKATILSYGIPYDPRLNDGGEMKTLQRWAKKLAKRAERKASKSVETYQKKHLVLVTKDGEKIFNNVKQHSSQEDREAFYKSWDWRTLRMKVIKKYGRRCMCCGSTPGDLDTSGAPVRIVVDHIKPLAKFWQLRLVPSNLQIMCDECNMGKGAWDETDHRTDAEKLIAEQLRYEI
jgi:5-methylcytosine-specific restriction endonuclease McrA